MKACIVRQRTRFFSGLLLSLCAVPASSTVEKSTLTLHGEIRAVEPAGTIGGRWANGHGETGGHLGLAAAHLTALIRRGPRHSFRADRRCAPPGHSAWRQHRGARKPQSERCTLYAFVVDLRCMENKPVFSAEYAWSTSGKGIPLVTVGSWAGAREKRRTSPVYGVQRAQARKQSPRPCAPGRKFTLAPPDYY